MLILPAIEQSGDITVLYGHSQQTGKPLCVMLRGTVAIKQMSMDVSSSKVYRKLKWLKLTESPKLNK